MGRVRKEKKRKRKKEREKERKREREKERKKERKKEMKKSFWAIDPKTDRDPCFEWIKQWFHDILRF